MLLLIRKVKVVDKDAILHLRIPPPPIPLPWGRIVKPYQPAAVKLQARSNPNPSDPATLCNYIEAEALATYAYEGLGKQFQVNSRPRSFPCPALC